VFAAASAPDAMERLVIRIEREADITVRDDVIRRVREAVSLRPEVEFVACGALYDHERSIKARRIVDLRSKD
jgi:phenylacetate-coenzyme A ligase PaaK-like adenylate-forming protein